MGRIRDLEKRLRSLELKVDQLSKVRNGTWHEAMYYERMEKRIKILKQRRKELWARYAFDRTDGRKQNPVMWQEYKELGFQIEALEGEYANGSGEGTDRTARKGRTLDRRKGGEVDVPEILQGIRNTQPDQPKRQDRVQRHNRTAQAGDHPREGLIDTYQTLGMEKE